MGSDLLSLMMMIPALGIYVLSGDDDEDEMERLFTSYLRRTYVGYAPMLYGTK